MKNIDDVLEKAIEDLEITDPLDKQILKLYLDMASDIGGIKALNKRATS